MGKQPRNLPEETLENEAVMFTDPPEELHEEPLAVKKKESTLVSGKDSMGPFKPSKPSSEKSISIDKSRKIVESLDKIAESTKTIGKEDAKDNAKSYFHEVYKAQNPVEFREKNPIKSFAKSAWNVLSVDLPTSLAAASAVLGEDPQVPAPVFTKEHQENLKEGKKDMVEWAINQQQEGAVNTKDLVNTLDKINDPIDALNWLSASLGQATGQIPLSVATGGASSFGQEVGSVYLDGIRKISEEKGITPKEVMDQGLDEPAFSLAYGTAAGLLDKIGAQKVMSAFKKDILKKSLRNRAFGIIESGITESVTEYSQTFLEQVGASQVAGKTLGEALTEAQTSKAKKDRLEAAAQGAAGGSGIHAVGLTMSPAKIVEQETKAVDVTDNNSLDTKAEAIQKSVEVNEAAVNTGKTDAPLTPPIPNDQAPQTTPTAAAEGTLEEGVVSEDDTKEKAPAPEAQKEPVEEGPKTMPIVEEQQPQTAKEQIDALVDSGDLQRDADNRVTILTEKGGVELKRILEENKIEHKNAIQEPSPESVPVREPSGDSQAVGEGDANQEIAETSTGSEQRQKVEEKPVMPQDVHTAAKQAGIDYESKEFMKASKDITGKEHLDDMNADELKQMVDYVKSVEPEPPTNNTGSVALDQPEGPKLSGIKKALVPADKTEATPIERRSTEQMLLSAKEKVDAGEINPKAIVDEIALGNARALQPDEVAGLVYYKTQLDNKSDQLNADLLDAIKSGDVAAQAALRPQIDAIDQEVDRYHTMSLKTAYEQSLAFRLRQMLLDNEYNLQSQINKYKVANGGKISAETEQKFKDLDKQLKAANLKIRQLEEEGSKSAATEAMMTVRQDLQRQREKRIKSAQQRKTKINDFFNSLKIKADPNKLNSITQVIGEAVFNGSIEAIRKAVLAGADVATAIQAGIDYINEHYRGNDFDEDQYRSLIEPGLEKIIPSEKDIAQPEVRNGKLYIPAKLIKALVEAGVKDINKLVDQIHDVVKEKLPNVSKREIRDAITHYGETRNLSQDDINRQLREIKRVGRLISSLEDVQNKKRPLRSGLQRDKLTDQERKLQRDIKEAMKDLPIDQADLDKSWKNALDAVKSRLKNSIADLENQIQTGEKSPKKKGIKYDQEANDLKAQRDKLKAIIEAMEGKPKMSDEQRVRMAVGAVERNISDLEERLKNQDTSKKEQTTTPETPKLKELRAQRDKLKSAYAQMEQDLGVAEQKRLEAFKKSLKKSTERYQQRLQDQDFVTKKKAPVAPDEEATKLKLERDKIKQEFDLEQEKARRANRPMNEKIWDTFIDLWNIPKSLLASIDMSAPFRQGAILSISNPKAGGRSFAEMFRQAFSEKKANEWLLRLRESPEYALIKQSKLYVAEPNTKLTAKEENFMSNFASRIPIIGPLVKGSERAYVGYLNKLRVDIFANGADRLRDQGITPENNPEAYKSLANFINNATGRGNLGALELAAPVLNGLFFSPRYLVSRLNLLNPVTYAKMPAPVRKMALKSVIAYIGFTALFIGLLGAASDDIDIELDPRSTDFGKVKLGNTRIDPWAGFQQVVRLIAQLVTGQKKNTKTGEIQNLDGRKFPFETRADVALRFGRSKLAPTASTVANVLSGKTVVGEEVTLQGELLKNVTPLYMQDLKEIYDEEGATGVILSAIPAFFGFGVQSYGGNSGLKNKEFDPKAEIQTTNQKNQYSFSNPGKADLSTSFGQEIDDDTYDEFYELRDKEIARLYKDNKYQLEHVKDIDIYDRMMDNITREAGRAAKYEISEKNDWDTSSFEEGNVFFLKNYKKDEDGKVVQD